MKFSEFEAIMFELGATNLADIARKLDSTPQSVSNWKARDQVPSHILIKVNQSYNNLKIEMDKDGRSPNILDQDMISLADVIEKIISQFKLIFLITFLIAFSTVIHTKFIQKPIYYSEAKVLIPDQKSSNGFGGLIGVASQFGVNIPSGQENKDLSSPSLYPELLHTRIFGEKILAKTFFSREHNKKLSLLSIINANANENLLNKEKYKLALDELRGMLSFNKSPGSPLSTIRVESYDPQLSKEIADEILIELEALSRRYKSKSVNEKINFIEKRINSVEKDLNRSEITLKAFNEQNRQINSPSLQLEQDRLTRELDIHRGIYLTLKQQLELSKIEAVQEKSIFQIVDRPQESYSPINKKVKSNLIISVFVGLIIGVTLGLLRDYINNNNIDNRKKIRRSKLIFRKKIKDIIYDYRMNGIFALTFFVALPLVLTHKSQNPSIFNMYSAKFFIFNIIYLFSLIFFLILFIKNKKKN